MGTSLNKGRFTVGGSNSKLGGESNHAIYPAKVNKPMNVNEPRARDHKNVLRELGMSVAMPNYGSSGRDGMGGALGKVKPFSGKMGGPTAGSAARKRGK